jgi:hypothetical protein
MRKLLYALIVIGFAANVVIVFGCHPKPIPPGPAQSLTTASGAIGRSSDAVKTADADVRGVMAKAPAEIQPPLQDAVVNHAAALAANDDAAKAVIAAQAEAVKQTTALTAQCAALTKERDAAKDGYDQLYNSWHERWYRTLRNWFWSLTIAFVLLQGLAFYLRLASPLSTAYAVGTFLVHFLGFSNLTTWLSAKFNPVTAVPATPTPAAQPKV